MTNQANPEMPVEPARLAEEWIQQINEAARNSSGWIIETGLILLRAKEQLPHGQWLSMWESRRMQFGVRTAEMLMRVARHPTLRDPKNISSLPVSWSILYVLSQLPADLVQQEIINRSINLELKLSGARGLLSRWRAGMAPLPTGNAPRPFNVTRQKSRVLRSLHQQSARWPAEHRAELAQLLETVAAQLRQAGNK